MMNPPSVQPSLQAARSRTTLALTVVAALTISMTLLCTTGCGQKGPLYLPDPAPTAVPAPDDNKDKQKRDTSGNGSAPTDGAAPADGATPAASSH